MRKFSKTEHAAELIILDTKLKEALSRAQSSSQSRGQISAQLAVLHNITGCHFHLQPLRFNYAITCRMTALRLLIAVIIVAGVVGEKEKFRDPAQGLFHWPSVFA